MSTAGDNRQFAAGFVQAACDERASGGLQFIADEREAGLRGFERLSEESSGADVNKCDSWEHTPTIVIQHEDIGNMYHNLADHMRIFLSLALLQQPLCSMKGEGSVESPTVMQDLLPTECPAPDTSSVFLGRMPVPAHSDAWTSSERKSETRRSVCGANGTLIHGLDPAAMQLLNLDARIMCNVVNPDGSPVEGEREDCEGPFFPQYRRWFGRGVVPGRFLKSRGRVCFSAIGWAANVPESHVWAHFREPWHCDSPASPLFEQYVGYVIARWGLDGARPGASVHTARSAWADGRSPPPPAQLPGIAHAAGAPAVDSLTSTSTAQECVSMNSYVRVLYIVRKRKPFNPAPVADQVVANEDELIASVLAAALRAGAASVEVDSADFTGMPFEEQLLRVRAAHLVIGMHGAGMVHAIHLAPVDSCGGATSVIEMLPLGHTEWGIGHLVGYAGRRYRRWVNEDGSREGPSGTKVDVGAIGKLVEEAVRETLATRRK